MRPVAVAGRTTAVMEAEQSHDGVLRGAETKGTTMVEATIMIAVSHLTKAN